VATGKEVSLTPEGDLLIVTKEANDQGLGQDGIFGTRWLGLETADAPDGSKYGIHGTNEPDSIGEHASAGCVRMAKNDLVEIYNRVPVGTVVRVKRGWVWHRYLVTWFSIVTLQDKYLAFSG
ncbi:MAG: L,D-transpeptidase, partial [Firmicutes bacterium]|nr:L,D-transpeptidase [Bacillota bacterium]